MPGRKDQRNPELKGAAQYCSKLTNIFKKSKPSEESASENQDITTFNLESEVNYLIICFYDVKVLADFTAHQYFYREKRTRFLYNNRINTYFFSYKFV